MKRRRLRVMVAIAAVFSLQSPPAASSPTALGAALPPKYLTAPTLISPAGYASSAVGPTLSWLPVPGALSYVVDVRTGPTGPSADCGGETRSLRITCDDLSAGPYWWSVRAVGVQNQTGPSSAQRVFTRSPRPFAAPTLTSPASGTVFTFPDGLSVLHWTPVPWAASSRIQYAHSPSFPEPPADPTVYRGPRHRLISSPMPTSARSPTGGSGPSASGEGTSGHGPPHAPSRWSGRRSRCFDRTKDNGAAVSTGVVSWAPMPGAQRYYVESAAPDDPTFANPTDHGWFTVPSMALPADDGTYLWRVRGWAPGGYSPWSAARLVTVDGDADPAPPPEDPGPVPPPWSTVRPTAP